MVRKRLTVIAMALSAIAPNALAQPLSCTDRTEFVHHLAKTYGEKRVGIGLADNGNLVEILSSISGQSWTLIMTTPDGVSCRIAAGNDWEQVPLTKSRGPY